MKYEFLQQRPEAHTLDLLMAGWAADAHIFEELPPTDADLVVCYDYRDLQLDTTQWKHYDSVRLAAWSMGVWAAEHTEALGDLPIVERTALNGTPWPIDDSRGIPEAIFLSTLGGFSDRNLVKFRHRMCGSDYRYFMNHLPQRPVEELRDELRHLAQCVPTIPVDSSFVWDKAFVGEGDLIIPVSNQQNAWRERGLSPQMVEGAHYSPQLFEQWRNDA